MSQPVMGRYVFVVQPVEAYEPLLPGTVMVIKTVLDVDGPMGNGPLRFVGICQASSDAEAREQLERNIGRLPPSVPELAITELRLATR
jgi:hypothetical protein